MQDYRNRVDPSKRGQPISPEAKGDLVNLQLSEKTIVQMTCWDFLHRWWLMHSQKGLPRRVPCPHRYIDIQRAWRNISYPSKPFQRWKRSFHGQEMSPRHFPRLAGKFSWTHEGRKVEWVSGNRRHNYRICCCTRGNRKMPGEIIPYASRSSRLKSVEELKQGIAIAENWTSHCIFYNRNSPVGDPFCHQVECPDLVSVIRPTVDSNLEVLS